jgi:NAD(P)-dependent dehydrogenase (short-subunit alcohol dehydrogenase family)
LRNLERTTAVVTGAGRGLGRAVAAALAREGARVIACDRTNEELAATERLIRSEGGEVEAHRFDLADPAACETFAATVGRTDALVNNAAVLERAGVRGTTLDSWTSTLAVNLTAPFLLIRSFLPGLLESGGSIVNVSSRAGVLGFENEGAYCASKFGLEGLTRALAAELEGVRVSANTVTPGLSLKPTSLTDAEASLSPARGEWNDPMSLGPAFVLLAGLRGEVSGCRFDALRLAEAVARKGGKLTAAELRELAG